MQIGKLALLAETNVFHKQELGRHAGFQCAVLQVLHRTAIFFAVLATGQMQQTEAVVRFQIGKTLNQLFLQAVVLIGLRAEIAGVDLVFQPQPLEEGRFIQRGWRIGIVLQQLGWIDAVVGQIEARIQRRLAGAP
ncbi:hypothetical protein D3C81_477870 [compost metagenome]